MSTFFYTLVCLSLSCIPEHTHFSQQYDTIEQCKKAGIQEARKMVNDPANYWRDEDGLEQQIWVAICHKAVER